MALETLSPDWEFDRVDDGSQSKEGDGESPYGWESLRGGGGVGGDTLGFPCKAMETSVSVSRKTGARPPLPPRASTLREALGDLVAESASRVIPS